MSAGPFQNMPELFPKSTLEDPEGFDIKVHGPGYRPPTRASGWHTSILRNYTVTYCFDGNLETKPPDNGEDGQENNGDTEPDVEIHEPGYCPPPRASGWRTGILPNYTVTYSYDEDVPSLDNEEEGRKSAGSAGLERESQEPYRAKHIGMAQKEQIAHGICRLDGALLDQAIAYLRVDRPDLVLANETELDIDTFSDVTLSRIHDLIAANPPGIAPEVYYETDMSLSDEGYED